jgi:hypothetical protein
VFAQTRLAQTIRSMIEAEAKVRRSGGSRVKGIDAVRDHFYRGDVARRIGAFVTGNHGLLRYEDMASFRLQPEEPVCTTYRGYSVCKPGFWSQGPVTIEVLNMLEGYDLRSLGHNSAEYLQTLVEWGWLGAFLWACLGLGALAWLIWSLVRHRGFSSRSERLAATGLAAALLATFTHALVDFPLQIASLQLYTAILVGICWHHVTTTTAARRGSESA